MATTEKEAAQAGELSKGRRRALASGKLSCRPHEWGVQIRVSEVEAFAQQ